MVDFDFFLKVLKMNVFIEQRLNDMLYVTLKMHRFFCVSCNLSSEKQLTWYCEITKHLPFKCTLYHTKYLFSIPSFFVEKTEPSHCIILVTKMLVINEVSNQSIRVQVNWPICMYMHMKWFIMHGRLVIIGWIRT